MSKQHGLAFGGLLGAMGVILALSSPVHSQRPAADETLAEEIARTTKVDQKDVDKVLNALSTVLRNRLSNGKTETLSGLGTFRVVQIEAHRDTGVNDARLARPLTVPVVNRVEFLPAGEMDVAANSSKAKPAEVVPEFKYVPLPDRTPGQKVGRTRVPPVRTK